MSISKTSYYHRPKKRAGDDEIKQYLSTLAQDHKRWGFDKMMQKIKLDGKPWNHKRVYRVYRELGLNIRVKPRKRIPKGEAKILLQPIEKNVCWSMDFMSDSLINGRKFRTLNVIDDYNREGLTVAPHYSLPAERVIQCLEQLVIDRGAYPEMIRVDNGPEFIAEKLKTWAQTHNILLHHIQPGSPAQNAFIERFNRTYREDVLDMNLFDSLEEVRAITDQWLHMYNNDRPHESLDGLTPQLFADQRAKAKAQLAVNRKGNSILM